MDDMDSSNNIFSNLLNKNKQDAYKKDPDNLNETIEKEDEMHISPANIEVSDKFFELKKNWADMFQSSIEPSLNQAESIDKIQKVLESVKYIKKEISRKMQKDKEFSYPAPFVQGLENLMKENLIFTDLFFDEGLKIQSGEEFNNLEILMSGCNKIELESYHLLDPFARHTIRTHNISVYKKRLGRASIEWDLIKDHLNQSGSSPFYLKNLFEYGLIADKTDLLYLYVRETLDGDYSFLNYLSYENSQEKEKRRNISKNLVHLGDKSTDDNRTEERVIINLEVLLHGLVLINDLACIEGTPNKAIYNRQGIAKLVCSGLVDLLDDQTFECYFLKPRAKMLVNHILGMFLSINNDRSMFGLYNMRRKEQESVVRIDKEAQGVCSRLQKNLNRLILNLDNGTEEIINELDSELLKMINELNMDRRENRDKQIFIRNGVNKIPTVLLWICLTVIDRNDLKKSRKVVMNCTEILTTSAIQSLEFQAVFFNNTNWTLYKILFNTRPTHFVQIIIDVCEATSESYIDLDQSVFEKIFSILEPYLTSSIKTIARKETLTLRELRINFIIIESLRRILQSLTSKSKSAQKNLMYMELLIQKAFKDQIADIVHLFIENDNTRNEISRVLNNGYAPILTEIPGEYEKVCDSIDKLSETEKEVEKTREHFTMDLRILLIRLFNDATRTVGSVYPVEEIDIPNIPRKWIFTESETVDLSRFEYLREEPNGYLILAEIHNLYATHCVFSRNVWVDSFKLKNKESNILLNHDDQMLQPDAGIETKPIFNSEIIDQDEEKKQSKRSNLSINISKNNERVSSQIKRSASKQEEPKDKYPEETDNSAKKTIPMVRIEPDKFIKLTNSRAKVISKLLNMVNNYRGDITEARAKAINTRYLTRGLLKAVYRFLSGLLINFEPTSISSDTLEKIIDGIKSNYLTIDNLLGLKRSSSERSESFDVPGTQIKQFYDQPNEETMKLKNTISENKKNTGSDILVKICSRYDFESPKKYREKLGIDSKDTEEKNALIDTMKQNYTNTFELLKYLEEYFDGDCQLEIKNVRRETYLELRMNTRFDLYDQINLKENINLNEMLGKLEQKENKKDQSSQTISEKFFSDKIVSITGKSSFMKFITEGSEISKDAYLLGFINWVNTNFRNLHQDDSFFQRRFTQEDSERIEKSTNPKTDKEKRDQNLHQNQEEPSMNDFIEPFPGALLFFSDDVYPLVHMLDNLIKQRNNARELVYKIMVPKQEMNNKQTSQNLKNRGIQMSKKLDDSIDSQDIQSKSHKTYCFVSYIIKVHTNIQMKISHNNFKLNMGNELEIYFFCSFLLRNLTQNNHTGFKEYIASRRIYTIRGESETAIHGFWKGLYLNLQTKEPNITVEDRADLILVNSCCLMLMAECLSGPCRENQKLIMKDTRLREDLEKLLRLSGRVFPDINTRFYILQDNALSVLCSLFEGEKNTQVYLLNRWPESNPFNLYTMITSHIKNLSNSKLMKLQKSRESHSKNKIAPEKNNTERNEEPECIDNLENLIELYMKDETFSNHEAIKIASKIYLIFTFAINSDSRKFQKFLSLKNIDIKKLDSGTENSSKKKENSLLICYQFLLKITGSIEVAVAVSGEEKNLRVTFLILPKCLLITNENIDDFLGTCTIQDQNTRLYELQEYVNEIQIMIKGSNSSNADWMLNSTSKQGLVVWLFSFLMNIIWLLFSNIEPLNTDSSENPFTRVSKIQSSNWVHIVIIILSVIICLQSVFILFKWIFFSYSTVIEIERLKKKKKDDKESELKNWVFRKLDVLKLYILDSLIYQSIPMIIFFHILFVALYYLVSEYFMCMHLVLSFYYFKTTKYIIKSVTSHPLKLGITFLLIIFAVYVFSTFIGYHYPEKFNLTDEKVEGMTISPCKTWATCLINSLDYGIRLGGGIGDAMLLIPSGQSYFLEKSLVNVLFLLIVKLIAQNIFLGIIIDTFSELRDNQALRESVMEERCFICSIPKTEFEKQDKDFKEHQEKEHIIKSYLYFMIYLTEKSPQEFSGVELYVYNLLVKKKTDWFPVEKTSYLKEEEQDGGKESFSDETDKDLKKALQELTKMLSTLEKLVPKVDEKEREIKEKSFAKIIQSIESRIFENVEKMKESIKNNTEIDEGTNFEMIPDENEKTILKSIADRLNSLKKTNSQLNK